MDKPQNDGRIGVSFLDVLFAIVMGISATKVLELPWVKWEPGFMWQASFGFEMGVLFLGYSLLILSWVGYHQSVGTIVQEIRTIPQWATFIIDILLLACYLLNLVKFDKFLFVLGMLFLVFSLYVVRDIFQQKQRASANKEGPQKMGVSRFWAICFTILLGIYWLLDLEDTYLVAVNWAFLVLAFAGVVLYRFHKKQLWPKPLQRRWGIDPKGMYMHETTTDIRGWPIHRSHPEADRKEC